MHANIKKFEYDWKLTCWNKRSSYLTFASWTYPSGSLGVSPSSNEVNNPVMAIAYSLNWIILLKSSPLSTDVWVRLMPSVFNCSRLCKRKCLQQLFNHLRSINMYVHGSTGLRVHKLHPSTLQQLSNLFFTTSLYKVYS